MTNKLKSYREATAELTRAEKIAQSFMPAVYINDTEDEIRKMEELIARNHIGGICFFHSRASAATNFEGPKEVIYNADSLAVMKGLIQRYQNAAKYPLLISIDAEWGLAMRVENTAQYPYAICLGAMPNAEELIYQVGHLIGLDCRQAGIHWNFAPVADVNNNPDNPVIGYRSFGEDPQLVARYAVAFSKGLQSAGILTSSKHFPGHGDTATDSHLGLPVIDKSQEELHANELVPFVRLMDEGVDSVMVGHLAVPALSEGQLEPSSASNAVINNFLRKTLGFRGVVVSDALNMHAVSKNFDQKGALEFQAYQSGTDVLCYCEHPIEGIQLIADNSTDDQIETHFKRVWLLKEKVMNQANNSAFEFETTQGELMELLARNSLCQVQGTDTSITDFSQKEYAALAVKKEGKSLFLDKVRERFNAVTWSTANYSIEEIQAGIRETEHILIALYPPSIKPPNSFGLSEKEINLIEELAQNKTVILYLFGNPYVLNLFNLRNFESVFVAFQDFDEFQMNAYYNFTGENKAVGKLPVTLNKKTYGSP